VSVEIISADQLPSVMKGIKSGDKSEKKALVEKVAEAKPVEDAVGKIDKKTVVTDAAPKEQPEPKPVEKKPDPPKDVEKKAEAPKAEKKAEPKPEPKIDPIAEAIKQESKKPQPKQETKSAPTSQAKPRERTFDQNQIAALLNKQDPSRQAATGDTLSPKGALGKANASAASNSATWGAMFRDQVERCWNKPYGNLEAMQKQAAFSIKLKRDGTLEVAPQPLDTNSDPAYRVFQESAYRAIIACQPYRLPAQWYEEWKFFEPVFDDQQRRT
jgi:outer membrane biosynthesis protein TonB